MIDDAIAELTPVLGSTRAACAVTGRAQASHYRRHRQCPPRPKPVRERRPQPRALSPAERDTVRAVLNSPDFVDKAPATVYHELLDEGTYLASVSTMYRVLRAHDEVHERRRQATHPARVRPELVATKPNEVWSWDITKLLGPAKWTYYYLYVLLDVFSRYVVGWLLTLRESARLAEKLIAESCERQEIVPWQLTVHADRGAAKSVALLLADLGVTRSHSRPHVSNDNPFSESHFKTLKYRPEFPERFGSPEHARSCVGDLLRWYNTEHHHVGLGLFTPHDVHFGLAEAKREHRARVLAEAFAQHPERFPNGRPSPRPLPTAVWINHPWKPTSTTR